ncbi:restriction endonuclease subunit S [Spongiibacter taiwanensis]|uniref:restriction endonuclease subunit S n=1 Tax=Spongiibacter taiwanensis TaxID=1748242 RepID=UPI0020357232|nr:restriction endonuclease subunit S [Spongiibacter taiwanensis]USA44730.1 restriction endonuclease subunit S [Spongiibacter taiwanensis]
MSSEPRQSPTRQQRDQKLSDLADIFMGATLSHYSKSPLEDAPKAKLITANAIAEQLDLLSDELLPVWLKKSDISRFIVCAGDVVLSARGRIRAVVIGPQVANQQLLPGANLVVIRPREPGLNSCFLAELFNSGESLRQMGLVVGSRIPSLRASDLKRLTVPSLSKTQQQAVVELARARTDAVDATMALAEQQYKTASQLIFDLIWDGSDT